MCIRDRLEPSHALSFTLKLAKENSRDKIIIMNMCGRGDKDVFAIAELLGIEI